MRTTITVASTAPLTRSAWERLSRDKRFRMGRACSPMITNASTFSTKTAFSHTEYVLTEDRRGCRGVRRGDDGAERDRGRDRKTSQPPADPRDGRGGQTNGDDDEGRERNDVPSQVAGRGVERRVQQDGGDEERERQIG